MPSHLHACADLQVGPGPLLSANAVLRLVGRMVGPRTPPATGGERARPIIDGGDGAAASGRPMIRGWMGGGRRSGDQGRSGGGSEVKERTPGLYHLHLLGSVSNDLVCPGAPAWRSVTSRAMLVEKLSVAGVDVRRGTDDVRPPHVAVIMRGRCMLASVGGCRNARLPKTRRGQRDRPEDRTGDESDERYRRTVGKAHGWLPRGPSALDRCYMPCVVANRGRATLFVA